MPGKAYRSIQNPRMYEAMRREGMSKETAARMSNAKTPGHKVMAGHKPAKAAKRPKRSG